MSQAIQSLKRQPIAAKEWGMESTRIRRQIVLAVLAGAVVCHAAHLAQADDKVRREAEKARSVKLLDADRKGEIEARWIAFNSAEGRLLVTNKTSEPLKVIVPSVMVAE